MVYYENNGFLVAPYTGAVVSVYNPVTKETRLYPVSRSNSIGYVKHIVQEMADAVVPCREEI